MKQNKQDIIEELGKLYQDYLEECAVYDGASFWSSNRVNELADMLVLKEKEGLDK